VKNFLTVTLLSLGVPMILMGDEVRRTQHGNNNAYCLDNETSWFDWTLISKHADVHRFVRLLVARRLLRDKDPERQRITLTELIRQAEKGWHGVKLGQPDWGDHSHSVAFSVELRKEEIYCHFIFNAFWEPLDFELPLLASAEPDPWRRWIDTSLESPHDIAEWLIAPRAPGKSYRAGPQSVVVLWARLNHSSLPQSR
jgi:glycogen operon protein